MLGSRVRASFCFATPFSLGSEKVFLNALAYSGNPALERQPLVVFFCFYITPVLLEKLRKSPLSEHV